MIILDKEGNVYNGINNQLIGDNVLIDGYELIISGIKIQHFCKNCLK
jgi:hypothetical protein